MQLKAYQCPRCHRKYNVASLLSTGEFGYKDVATGRFHFCSASDGKVICPDCDQEGHGCVELELLLESVPASPALTLVSLMSFMSVLEKGAI